MSKFIVQVAVCVTIEGNEASVEPMTCEVQERAEAITPQYRAQLDTWKKKDRRSLDERAADLVQALASPPPPPPIVVNQEWPLDYQRTAERFVSWGILPGEIRQAARTHGWPRLARCEAWIVEKQAAEGVSRPDKLLTSLLKKK